MIELKKWTDEDSDRLRAMLLRATAHARVMAEKAAERSSDEAEEWREDEMAMIAAHKAASCW